jgi:hypothetical protein
MGLTCNCDKWDKNIKSIDVCCEMSTIHGFDYKGEQFIYCPWCGQKLTIKAG